MRNNKLSITLNIICAVILVIIYVLQGNILYLLVALFALVTASFQYKNVKLKNLKQEDNKNDKNT